MYLDAFTLAALVDEFADLLVGGRIQDVIDVDATGMGLEIYVNHRRHYLYLSADRQTPRVHLVFEKLRRGLQQPTQIGLLFRRYVEGGRLVHVSQPPYERVIQFDVDGPEGSVSILAEPMERRSNLLLLRDGVILDCVHRVGPQDNRVRLSLPNHAYQPPPPQVGKFDPSQLDVVKLDYLLENIEDPKQKLVRLLTSAILGLSPLLAREIVYRAAGDVDVRTADVDSVALHDAIQGVVGPLVKRLWQPGEVVQDGVVIAYSVYPITHLQGWQLTETVSAAMSAYYGIQVGPEAYAEAKKPVQAAIDEGKAKLRAKLASMESGLKDDAEREMLQQSGELILAYQYAIQPGQTELHAQYHLDEPELVIKLDPSLTPLENAQRYFDKYNRAKRAQAGVPQLIESTKNEYAYLEHLASDLEVATNWPEIDDVIQALQVMGLMGRDKPLKRIGGGGRSTSLRLTYDGYVIWVGRNSRQNEDVTFKKAKPQDMWLHAQGVPGAHVVIRDDGRRMTDSLIEKAAAIAAYYSRSRSEKHVMVDMTRVKYVKKIKGAGMGMVTYRNEKTITVIPQSEEILDNGT